MGTLRERKGMRCRIAERDCGSSRIVAELIGTNSTRSSLLQLVSATQRQRAGAPFRRAGACTAGKNALSGGIFSLFQSPLLFSPVCLSPIPTVLSRDREAGSRVKLRGSRSPVGGKLRFPCRDIVSFLFFFFYDLSVGSRAYISLS